MNIITLICDTCSKCFDRSLSLHNGNVNRGRIKKFCSKKCLNIYNKQFISVALPLIEVACGECKVKVYKKNKDLKRAKNGVHFCSRKCATIFFGKKRKTLPKMCNECGKSYKRKATVKKCSVCISRMKNRLLNVKKKDTTHPKIRSHARVIYFRTNKNANNCENCGYDKHIQICHKKNVSDFGDEARLKDINHIKNLIGLCPNCHWEFDNGLLKL